MQIMHFDETNQHNKDCANPVGKRLYIRDYNDEGKSCFVPWGLTCTTCGVVIKEKFQHNLPKSQKERKERYDIHDKELFEHVQQRKIMNKLERLQRKGQPPITPSERSMRMKLYKFEGSRNYCLGLGRQYRPNDLCEKFLSLKPRPTMKELYEALYPLGYDPHKSDKNRYIHLIPDPDPNRRKTAGYINMKLDTSPWTPDPENPGKEKFNSDPNFKSDWDKTIEEETRLRNEVMKRVIESRGEKVPKEKTKEELEDMEKKRLEKIEEAFAFIEPRKENKIK
jgi:hypothetical protein